MLSVECVGMEGADGGNVSSYLWEGGENVSPGEDKCISNIDVGKPRREKQALVL